jgi:hypothetical protein
VRRLVLPATGVGDAERAPVAGAIATEGGETAGIAAARRGWAAMVVAVPDFGPVTTSDQLFKVSTLFLVEPLSPNDSFQVPLMFLPLKALNKDTGRNVPVNGAAPATMGVAAESSNVVLVKFEPVLFIMSISVTAVPSGAVSWRLQRLLSFGRVMLITTFRS